MRLLLITAVVGALTCAYCPRPAAAILIDSYDFGALDLSATAGGSNTGSESPTDGGVLGGERTIDIPGSNPVTGPTPNELTVKIAPLDSEGSFGYLTFSLDADMSGSTRLTYDGSGSDGLNGLDLTDGGASSFFSFDIIDIDQGDINLIVSVEDTGGDSGMVTLSGVGVGVQQIPFALFPNSVNMNAAEVVTLEVQGVNASDLVLDNFYTSGQIPEPGSLLMLTMCLGTLVGARMVKRRRNK